MCLGVPGRIVSVDGPVAKVDFFGVQREVRLDVVDAPVAPGDYILNHVGYAIRRIPDEEIGATLALYELLLDEARKQIGDDLMAADVVSEIGAGRDGDRDRGGGR
jgi:hydrogenase expression/formation protein HypC